MRVWLFLMLIGWSTFATGRAWGGEDTPPTITNLPAALIINRNSSSASLSFTIADDKTAAGSMIPVATSSNEAVIPVIKCELSGSGKDRFLKITPTLNQTGSSNITVTIQDELNQPTSHAIEVTVNGPPTMENLPPTTTTNLNTKTTALMFTVGDVLTPVGSLTMSVASSSNSALIPMANCVFGGSGASRTVTIEPAAGLSGSSIILLQVTDAGDSTGIKLYAQQSITVTVDAPPMISPLPGPLIINQYGSSSDIPFTVSDVLTLAANLTTTVTTSNATVIPADKCIITTTAGATNRSLKITPVSGQFADNIVIRVTVADGSTQTSYQEITVSVKEINRPPVITPANVAINYSLNVSGYAQIMPEFTTSVSDADGSPTFRTGTDRLRITASVTANGTVGQDEMVVRATNECVLSRNGSNYYISPRSNPSINLADVTFNPDGSLTLVTTDAAETYAATVTPAPGRATVVAWLLKTIAYTNLSGRFASNPLLARTVTLNLIEGRPVGMLNGQTAAVVTAVITPLLSNEPPANVAFEDLSISPGGTGAIVLKSSNGPLPGFDDQTADDNLQFTLVGQPSSGQLIDLVTGATITTFLGGRVNPATATVSNGIGYRNINPNVGGDGLIFQVADAAGLFTTANLAVRISFGTNEARIISDPLLVIHGPAAVPHPLKITGPTGSIVQFAISALPRFANAQSVTLPAAPANMTTDSNGSATASLIITPPAGTDYLAFLLTCTVGNSTTKQPFIIRLMPSVVPLNANN